MMKKEESNGETDKIFENKEKTDLKYSGKMKTTSSNKIKSMTFTAMFVAIIAVLSQISIPMPNMVPVTLQTFAVSLTGYYLGAKQGVISIIVYIMLGAAGAPVFTLLKGGFSVLIGYTGGFVWGFVPLVILCGIGTGRKKSIALGTVGILLCHLCGALQYMFLSSNSFLQSLILVSFPYILKDLITIPVAFFISERIKKQISVQ